MGIMAVALVGALPGSAQAGTERTVTASGRGANGTFSSLPPINLGDTVKWIATEGDHQVATDGGSFESEAFAADYEPHAVTFTPPRPGKYTYHCTLSQMTGTIEVLDPSGATTTTEPPTTTTTRGIYHPTTSTTRTTATSTTVTTAAVPSGGGAPAGSSSDPGSDHGNDPGTTGPATVTTVPSTGRGGRAGAPKATTTSAPAKPAGGAVTSTTGAASTTVPTTAVPDTTSTETVSTETGAPPTTEAAPAPVVADGVVTSAAGHDKTGSTGGAPMGLMVGIAVVILALAGGGYAATRRRSSPG
jgi:plastocyanin